MCFELNILGGVGWSRVEQMLTAFAIETRRVSPFVDVMNTPSENLEGTIPWSGRHELPVSF